MQDGTDAKAILDRLAALCGIQSQYTDVWGKRREVSALTQRALLATMGFRLDGAPQAEAALAELESRRWRRVLPPVRVAPETQRPLEITLNLSSSRSSRTLTWRLMAENGDTYEGNVDAEGLAVRDRKTIGGIEYRRCAFDLPLTLAPGYHRLVLNDDQHGSMMLIITPAVCYQPPALRDGRRAWGLTAQLYALRSRRNWGIGDFTDLRQLIDHAASLGADAVGLNPLHVLYPDNPLHRSPYSPSSRLFFNYLYLDVEEIAEFELNDSIRQSVRASDFQRRLQALRDAQLVDYAGVAAAKLPVLERLFDRFRERPEGERANAFQAFKNQGGEPLYYHALFETLHEHFSRQAPALWGWSAWPEEFRNPASQAVAAFAAEHRDRVEFYLYLQWQIGTQLAAACEHARRAGLGVGLYQDLAVGVDREGAEAWAHQRVYATGASVGAPPDLYNLKGQDWGVPPLIPMELAETGYALFIATLRNNMRHSHALRIDHVMGLMRLFWVPAGEKSDTGAYVHYPLQDLLGILALESQRNRNLIIGEDLGTVPEEVRQALGPLGVLSYRVMYFEKRADGSFKKPAEYPTQAVAAISTHDLPTLAGFWDGTDLAVRRELELFPSADAYEQQIIERASDRARLLAVLEQEGLLPEGVSLDPARTPSMSDALASAVHRFVARSPSQLLLVQLEDGAGQREAVNLPATTDAHPNWQRKLEVSLEELATHERMRKIAEAVRLERTGPEPRAKPVERPLASTACVPRCTYRLQFNHEFTFTQAAELAPYLQNLGVSHCYASPYLKARPGSMHGYDIIDHNALNPEIGSEDDYRRYAETLKRVGMSQVLDIVPNHVGVMGSDNAWWSDLLEHGPASPYADFFDVDWSPLKRELHGKVLLPVLGDHYGAVLARGELVLEFDAAQGSLQVRYFEHVFPIDPSEYPRVLRYRLADLEAGARDDDIRLSEFKSLVTAFEHLPTQLDTAPEKVEERARDTLILKGRLAALCAEWPALPSFIADNVQGFNGEAGKLDSFELLHQLLEHQAYRLAYWRVAADEINYRRFFDINDLAALRMEDERVFEVTHYRVLEMVARGELDGLRIDHPDGLYDPAGYYRRLQGHAAKRTQRAPDVPTIYLIVEKILASHERLPQDWPVSGTSGYDFTNLVNGLFIDPAGERPLDRTYSRFMRQGLHFEELLYACKKRIIRQSLSSELNVLANRLSRICEADPRTRDYTQSSLRDALAEIVACFPVYRTYVTAEGASPQDRQYVDWAIAQAKKRSQAAETTVFDFIRTVLLVELPQDHAASHRAVAMFAMRFQQYTAPVMAKGFEDTALYNYNRLVSLNEVGGDPQRFGISVSAFHHLGGERARFWPHSMLGTTTHDTKRAEDVRARINVLSEIPRDWEAQAFRWARINRSRKRRLDQGRAPDRNDEYLLYQTLIGSWPLDDQDPGVHAAYVTRIKDYMLKAAREAKRRTAWTNPDEVYEQALVQFVDAVLNSRERNLFLEDFVPFAQRVARLGMYNSLGQVLVKFTMPGVPDIYQGTELWDLSLVDPDNRRPVDYGRRRRMLDELMQSMDLEEPADGVRRLLEQPDDGRIKLYLTWRLLSFRRERPQLFRDGGYQALDTRGPLAAHLCAFARTTPEQTAVAVTARLFNKITDGGARLPIGDVWAGTWLQAPPTARAERYTNVLTGETLSVEAHAGAQWLPACQVLRSLPVVVLEPAV